MVMEGGGKLDQAVKEQLLLALRFQPQGFQRLVALKEFLRIEEPMPSRKVSSIEKTPEAVTARRGWR